MIGRMFPSWIQRTVDGTNDYAGASFRALLLKSTYTFDSTDIFISDLSVGTNELGGATGYIRATPTGLAISRTGSITTVTFNPIVFSLITATGAGAARSMVLALWNTADSNSPLILQQDFESSQDANTEDVTITPSPSGLIRYTSSP